MKIIDNKKDYYDYMVSKYGLDPIVTFDRRGSVDIMHELLGSLYLREAFSNKPQYTDGSKNNKRFGDKELHGNIYKFCLEVGYIHYIFSIERWIDDNELYINIKLENTTRTKHKMSDSVVSVIPIITKYYLEEYAAKEFWINNPILKNTYIPKYICAEEMWNNIYEYVSSQNDKQFTDSRSNNEHIESAGFDLKTSFRGK